MKSGTLILILSSTLLKAQIGQDWVNNFCCFDSIAPHTFSYPLGNFVDHDTLLISFFEDGYLNFKKIESATGNDIQIACFQNDTIQSPANYGGGTTMLNDLFISVSMKYNILSGITFPFISCVDRNFNLIWSRDVLSHALKISTPVNSLTGNDFYNSWIGDSIDVTKCSSNGTFQWTVSIPAANMNDENPPYIFMNSANEPVIVVRPNDSTLNNSCIRAIKLNPADGTVMLDTIFINTNGKYHILSQNGDTLKVVYIKLPGNTISFMDFNLQNFNVTDIYNSSLMDFYSITRLAVDPSTHNYYIKTNSNIYGFSVSDTLLFNTATPSASDEVYDIGNINFDQQGNLVIAYSFINTLNNPVNGDLIVLNVDKGNGNILQTFNYNDARNTTENYICQFSVNNELCVVFANNFDNLNILQEETQLGILKLFIQPLSIETPSMIEKQISIFPNPSETEITIKVPIENLSVKYLLYDSALRLLKTSQITNEEIISIEEFTDGIYFLKFTASDGTYSMQKIIKQ